MNLLDGDKLLADLAFRARELENESKVLEGRGNMSAAISRLDQAIEVKEIIFMVKTRDYTIDEEGE